MRARSLIVPLILGFLTACGSSGEQSDTAAVNQDTAQAAAAGAGTEPASDSIPSASAGRACVRSDDTRPMRPAVARE